MDKQGRRRDYESAYLRRTFRVEGKVKNETVANLSALPGHVIDWIDAGLKGEQLIPAEAAASIERSLPHGHLAAVYAQAKALGLPGLLGMPCRGTGPGAGIDRFPGSAAGFEAVHLELVGGHHPGCGSGRGGGLH